MGMQQGGIVELPVSGMTALTAAPTGFSLLRNRIAFALCTIPANLVAAEAIVVAAGGGLLQPRPFVLPPLPYAYNALEPHIDEATMRVHHTRHHQTYTDRLNDAWEQLSSVSPELAALPLRQVLSSVTLGTSVPTSLAAALRNHGGGFLNHALFWEVMAPPGSEATGTAPADSMVGQAIVAQWGSFAAFQAAFGAAAKGVFGSGWAWLVVDVTWGPLRGQLEIVTTANQDLPDRADRAPILLLDVWEHVSREGAPRTLVTCARARSFHAAFRRTTWGTRTDAPSLWTTGGTSSTGAPSTASSRTPCRPGLSLCLLCHCHTKSFTLAVPLAPSHSRQTSSCQVQSSSSGDSTS